jgi:cytochrome c peroxidase
VDCNTVTYSGTIVPIIQTNCLGSGCHGSGSSNDNFTVYAGIKTQADNGKLENRVLDKKDMPPDGLSRNERNKMLDRSRGTQ